MQRETSCKKFPPATPFKNSYMAGGIIGASVGAHGGAPSWWDIHLAFRLLIPPAKDMNSVLKDLGNKVNRIGRDGTFPFVS